MADTKPAQTDDGLLDMVFGEGGLVSQYHENYEYREGQIKMAAAIARTFEEKKHLIVEVLEFADLVVAERLVRHRGGGG